MTLRFLVPALAFLCTVQVQALDLGKLPPPISAQDAAGKAVDLNSYRGKVVYLDFWASWCGPCRKSFPWMNALSERYSKDGLVVLAINVDEQAADAQRFLQKYPAKFTVLYDAKGDTPRAYNIPGMPSSFVLDRQGILRLSHTGFREGSAAELEASVSNLLKVTTP